MTTLITRDGSIFCFKTDIERHEWEKNFPQDGIYAKNINNKEFFVLSDCHGDLFNTIDSTYRRQMKDTTRGKLKFNLIKCTKRCYDNYTRFLRTKNLVDFHCAKRSFING